MGIPTRQFNKILNQGDEYKIPDGFKFQVDPQDGATWSLTDSNETTISGLTCVFISPPDNPMKSPDDKPVKVTVDSGTVYLSLWGGGTWEKHGTFNLDSELNAELG